MSRIPGRLLTHLSTVYEAVASEARLHRLGRVVIRVARLGRKGTIILVLGITAPHTQPILPYGLGRGTPCLVLAFADPFGTRIQPTGARLMVADNGAPPWFPATS